MISVIKFENECVGCQKEMGCLGSGCPYTHVPYLFCDKCGSDAEVLYNTEEGQLCRDCVTGDIEDYEVINEDNVYDFTSPEEQDDDYYDYADLAYEMKRDERWEEDHG